MDNRTVTIAVTAAVGIAAALYILTTLGWEAPSWFAPAAGQG